MLMQLALHMQTVPSIGEPAINTNIALLLLLLSLGLELLFSAFHCYYNFSAKTMFNDSSSLFQCYHADSVPEPRRAAAGALFTTPNTTRKHILIHGGRLAAGHILDDLWQGSLGAGNITYQKLWPPQLKQDALQKKGKKQRPFGPKARKGHAAVAVEGPDACLVSVLSCSVTPSTCACFVVLQT